MRGNGAELYRPPARARSVLQEKLESVDFADRRQRNSAIIVLPGNAFRFHGIEAWSLWPEHCSGLGPRAAVVARLPKHSTRSPDRGASDTLRQARSRLACYSAHIEE